MCLALRYKSLASTLLSTIFHVFGPNSPHQSGYERGKSKFIWAYGATHHVLHFKFFYITSLPTKNIRAKKKRL
jgi:hypothetical protein